MRASAVILAGGNGRRLGEDKACLCSGGKPLLPMIVQELGRRFPEVWVAVGRRRALPLPRGVRVVEDFVPGKGPLAGLHAGLVVASYPRVVAVACDMPFPSRPLLARLGAAGGRKRAAVFRIRGYLEPFPGAYPRALLPQLEEALREGLGVQGFLERVPHLVLPETEARSLDPELRSFVNLNTPQDVRRWL